MYFSFSLVFFFPLLFTNIQARTLQKRTARETSPSGCLVVQGTNPTAGQFSTFTAAITALGSGTTSQCIFIYPGTYNEQVTVEYNGPLTIYGYTSDTSDYANNQVTIASSETSTEAGDLDPSAAVNFVRDSVSVYNVNFENTFGEGTQAVALTANADFLGFYGCQFIGWQDTLYAKAGAQYYAGCYIEGGVDWIFGDAAAWFEDCTIAAKQAGGSVTANSRTVSTDPGWYVFNSCTVEAASGFSLSGEVFLGRPWRVLARVIYQFSSLSNIINPLGWSTLAANATPIFEEFENTGAGSGTSKRIFETVATAAVTMTELWGDDFSWIDSTFLV